MSNIQTHHEYRVDLEQCPLEVALTRPLSHQDALADTFIAHVRRGAAPVSLAGMQVYCYLYFAGTRQTLPLAGLAAGSAARLTLTAACYASPGPFSLVLQLQEGGTRHTILRVNGSVAPTAGGEVIDPEAVLPTLAELLTEIDAMHAAGQEAREAAAEALNAAEEARAAREEVIASSAPPILKRLHGTRPSGSDAAEGYLFPTLRVFGRSTQAEPPSPTSPAAFTHLCGSGSLTVRICGQNLFPGGGVQEMTFADEDGSTLTRWGCAFSLPAGAYTVSPHMQPGAVSGSLSCVISDAEGACAEAFALVDGTTLSSRCITVGSDSLIRLYDASDAGQDAAAALFAQYAVQVIAGEFLIEEDLPVQGAGATLTVPGPMRSVRAAVGGSYTDADDQTWLADEIDLVRGVHIRRVGEVILDGVTPGRMASSKSATAKVNAFNISTADWNRLTGASVVIALSHYEFRGTAPSSATLDGDYVMICSNPGSMYVGHDSIGTLEDFNSWLAAQHAAGTPVTVLYPLSEPVETPLAGDELAAIRALRSVHPCTTVLAEGAWIEGEYIADTRTYIDNRLAAIAASILSI